MNDCQGDDNYELSLMTSDLYVLYCCYIVDMETFALPFQLNYTPDSVHHA